MDFFRAIEGSQGLTVYDPSVTDELLVAILSEKISRGFDDTLQYFVAEKIGAKAIVISKGRRTIQEFEEII